MTRRLRIVIASAVVLVGLLLIVILSFIGVTHTGFGQERVRRMVGTMLEGRVKGKVYIGHMSGGFFNGVTIDSVEIRDDEDSVFFASGPIRVEYDPRDLFDRRILLSHLEAHRPVVHLRQHENGDWNFRRIFPASDARGEEGRARIRPVHRRRLVGDPRCDSHADAAMASVRQSARGEARQRDQVRDCRGPITRYGARARVSRARGGGTSSRPTSAPPALPTPTRSDASSGSGR